MPEKSAKNQRNTMAFVLNTLVDVRFAAAATAFVFSFSCRYSLVVKTPDSHSGKPGSIPGAPYDFDLDFYWLCLLSTVLLYCMTLRHTCMFGV